MSSKISGVLEMDGFNDVRLGDLEIYAVIAKKNEASVGTAGISYDAGNRMINNFGQLIGIAGELVDIYGYLIDSTTGGRKLDVLGTNYE